MSRPKCIQSNPITLTGAEYNQYYTDECERLNKIHERIAPYFSQIIIGEKTSVTNKKCRTYTCSLFQLFINESFRNQFLDYTIASVDEVEISLRNILIDDRNIQKNILKIAGRFGDLCKKYNVPSYEIGGFSYTKENYLKGGENQVFRIALDGSKKEGTFDLTPYYEERNACLESEVKVKR